MNWQPIETAPKGELVIVADGAMIAVAVLHLGTWHFWEGGIDDEENANMNSWLPNYGPTHWMPLPAPPEVK
jgi:hypothetical protein